ncbi:MAG: hypothetical protein GY737_13925 [Desulfobacteraceae bacterium]|nr:hypothetical protein [Desulfobacteraceae bacterium]
MIKKQRGGKRPGAGRKPGVTPRRIKTSITLSPATHEWVIEQPESISTIAERGIRMIQHLKTESDRQESNR